MNPQQPLSPGDQESATDLLAILSAAMHWDRLHLQPHEQAVLSNWLFEENRVAGDVGIVRITEPTPERPGPVAFVNCTFRQNDALLLADVLIDLVNDALGQ